MVGRYFPLHLISHPVAVHGNLNDALKYRQRALICVNVVLAGRIGNLASSLNRAGVQANKASAKRIHRLVAK